MNLVPSEKYIKNVIEYKYKNYWFKIIIGKHEAYPRFIK